MDEQAVSRDDIWSLAHIRVGFNHVNDSDSVEYSYSWGFMDIYIYIHIIHIKKDVYRTIFNVGLCMITLYIPLVGNDGAATIYVLGNSNSQRKGVNIEGMAIVTMGLFK